MKYFIVVLMLLFGTVGWSQTLQFLFRGRIENVDLGKNEGGVTISIVQDGNSVSSTNSSSNGKYTLKGNVDYNQPFDVVFSKSGLVSKRVGFDFSALNEEDTPASAEFQPLDELNMTLFKERDNVDFSFLDSEPVAAFDWNDRKMAARLDGTVVSRMRNKIDKLLNEAENAAAKLEADYQAAIRAGDEAFAENRYEDALASFEEALGYKPNEKYPADKILELDALIRDQKNAELAEKQENQEYYNLIEAADNLRDDGSLEKAVSTYKEASGKRPAEQYPKDQIAAIQDQIDALADAEADEEAYKEAIKMGDVFLKQNSLRPAKDKYEAASKLKPEESYPKEKLKEIEAKMAALEEQEAKKKKYDDAITAADIAYDAEDFQGAKDKYQEALTFEKSSTYAKGRIAMCDDALANSKAEEERLAKIQELLDKGNADLTGLKYDDAVVAFSEVLTLDAENAEATAKLAEAQSKIEELADEAEREKQYVALITEGDQANTAKNLEDALTKYESAKALKDTPEVNEKISSVQDAINLAKSEAEKEDNYNALIADAESKFGSDDLQGAIDKYTEAIAVDASKPEPAAKITEIQALIDERASDQAKSEQFASLMKEGNDLMAANDLENAKSKFQEAITVDAASPEPQAKIDEIDALIAENEADQAKNEEFAALMKEGNDLMAANDLEKAKDKFQEAIAVDGANPEPQNKIDEIDALIAQNASDEAEQEKQANLQAAIEAGDNFFNEAKWDDAQAKYREAITIDPNNQYAKDRVSEIDFKIEEGKTRAQVELLLTDAKSLKDNDKLEDARSKYQEVVAIDPTNTTAIAQIEEINSEIAAQQNAEEKEQAFADLKAAGEQLFSDDQLVEAKQKFNEALSFKDDEGVKQKIVEIDELIAANTEQAELDKQKAELEAEQAAIDEQYANFIQTAESGEATKDYAAAISAYEQASGVKPNEDLPKEKVKELTDLMAEIAANSSLDEQYNNFIQQAESKEATKDYASAISAYEQASGVKPNEDLPKEKVKELTDLMAEIAANSSLDQKYNGFIQQAESNEANKDYTAAISAYEQASGVKPNEALPKQKIQELTDLLANIEANKANQAEVDKDYNAAMKLGENLMASEDYLDAITAFNDALALKPTEQEPKDRAAAAEEAERLKGDGNAQYEKILSVTEAKIKSGDFDKAEELINRAKMFKPEDKRPDELLAQVNDLRAIDKKYNDFMSSGESEAGNNNYKGAITQFESALSLKPSETDPKNRIEEMNRLLKDASSVNQKEALYQSYMDKGQAAMSGNNFVEALGHYQNALSVKNGDQVAQDKVNEIQQILDDIANSDKEKLEKKNKFDALIKDADKLFSESRYLQAKAKYDDALGVDPYSRYAKERGDECAKLAADAGKVEAEAQYRKLVASADKSFDEENWEKAKDYYNRAINIRKTDPYPKKRLAEIEAIENPPIVQSVKLESLGEEYNGSILDGAFIIQTEEEKRKLSKGIRIQEELNKVNASQADMAVQNQSERLGTQNEIYSIWEKVAVSTEGANDSREALIAKLRKAEQVREEKELQELAYEKGENLSAQDRLNSSKAEFILNQSEGDERRQERVEGMKDIQTSHEEETYRQGSQYIQRKYDADQSMNQVAIRVEEDIKDDYEERLEIDRMVNTASDEIQEVSKAIGESKYNNIQRQKAGIELIKSDIATKNVEDSQMAGDNNERVKEIRSDANAVALAYMQQNNENSEEVNAEIAEVKRKVIADNTGFDKVRKEANERLKDIQTDQARSDELANAGQQEKYLANKQKLTEEERKRKDVSEKAEIAMDRKIAYVNEKDRQAHEVISQGQLSDEEERLNAREKIVNQEIAKSNKTKIQVESQAESTENIKDMKKASDAKTDAEGIAQRDKNLAAQQNLDKIANTKKEKVVIANSLGSEYPEGVSQEMFTRKDEAGLVTTVITRRIVVVQGHADVYVRTQSKNGITYSKNGNPSLSHVWNSETQGPDLERHY